VRSYRQRDDDFDVLADGVSSAASKAAAVPVGMSSMRSPLAAMKTAPRPRLRADARGRDGGVREELAAGVRHLTERTQPSRLSCRMFSRTAHLLISARSAEVSQNTSPQSWVPVHVDAAPEARRMAAQRLANG
jgi:hypothetical protein